MTGGTLARDQGGPPWLKCGHRVAYRYINYIVQADRSTNQLPNARLRSSGFNGEEVGVLSWWCQLGIVRGGYHLFNSHIEVLMVVTKIEGADILSRPTIPLLPSNINDIYNC